jgi:Flp pilus assembly pilin Flp
MHKHTLTSFMRLSRNEGGQAASEYALVAVMFGLLMFAFLATIRTNTGSNLNTTQSGLTNLYKASPAP